MILQVFSRVVMLDEWFLDLDATGPIICHSRLDRLKGWPVTDLMSCFFQPLNTFENPGRQKTSRKQKKLSSCVAPEKKPTEVEKKIDPSGRSLRRFVGRFGVPFESEGRSQVRGFWKNMLRHV